MSETQVGGDHYKKLKIPPFQYSMANGLDAMQHTAVKYITRFRSKNGILDLEKARDTINQLIDYENNRLGGKVPDATQAFPKIDWALIMKDLCNTVADSRTGSYIERIVVVPRGGLTLSHVIAERLDIKEVELFDPTCIYEGNVLLVDDINDSGDTLNSILKHPDRFRGGVKTVVLAQRYSSLFKADFIGSVIKHDDYVVFPWESIDEQK